MSLATHTLASHEWKFKPRVVEDEFSTVKFLDTAFDFGNIVKEAMDRIERVILNGKLYAAAEQYLATEKVGGQPLGMEGFNFVLMAKYLKYGEFKYTLRDQLVIGGTGEQVYGSAPINGFEISLNAAVLTHTGHSHFRGNAGKLAALTGATIIHEVMHNHGFRHPGKAGDLRYESSFPEIAGEAFLLQQFPDNSLNGFFLTESGFPNSIACNSN